MVSDIVLKRKLPDSVMESIDAYVGCISGAALKDSYLEAIKSAGFDDVTVIDESIFPLDFMADDPAGQAIARNLEEGVDDLNKFEELVSSIKVRGIKPSL